MKSRRFKTKFAGIVAVICMIAATPYGSAQLRYGFRFGGDFSSAKLSNAGDYSLRRGSGFSGGLMLEYQMTTCGFAPDIAVLYGRHNVNLEHPGDAPTNFGKNFIDIPLRLKYKFWIHSMKDLFAPMVYTGPQLSVRLGGDSSPLLARRLQAGWDVGIGFDIVNFIQITGGYTLGLGNAAKSLAGYPDTKLRTDSWHIAANIIFDF